jgi:hypothetical protein
MLTSPCRHGLSERVEIMGESVVAGRGRIDFDVLRYTVMTPVGA